LEAAHPARQQHLARQRQHRAGDEAPGRLCRRTIAPAGCRFCRREWL
jgi:hypothetical protein